MRHIPCLLLLLPALWAQTSILGTVSLTGGQAFIDVPTSSLVGTAVPMARMRLQNNTGFTATDISILVESAPGCTGAVPGLDRIEVAGVPFIQNAGAHRVHEVIAPIISGGAVEIDFVTSGAWSAATTRLTFMLSMHVAWTPEVEILSPVILGQGLPAMAQRIRSAHDAGVIFWVENAGTGPQAALNVLELTCDFLGATNAIVRAEILDEFSLLPLAGTHTVFDRATATFAAVPLLAPLERAAVLLIFERPLTNGIVVDAAAQ